MDRCTEDLLKIIEASGFKLCPTCNGAKGFIEFDDLNDIDTARFEPCPMCHGSGFVRNYKQED